jgi:DNA-binding CsgD family transcriptional regulator
VLDQFFDVPAPMYETAALLVLAECAQPDDVNAALDAAHRALAAAADAGLWPSVVDALEAIGVMLVEVGRERDGARALAAASAARDAMSYRYRFAHRATAVAAAADAVRGDDGWAEGSLLLLPEAVELAQRMRGERVRPVTGWDSLTPTEEQVAAGLTNPQIAERLLMSRATVKTHLVHVYSKLGIGSRAELAAAAVRRSRR